MIRKYKPSFLLSIAVVLILTLAGCSGGSGGDSSDPGQGSGNPGTDPDPDPETPKGTGIFPDLAVHDKNVAGKHFSGSGQCDYCHDGMLDERSKVVTMGKAWSTSMMANASRDPYWMAKVAAEIKRHPALEEEINTTCSRCHMPMAHETLKKSGGLIKIFEEDDGMLSKDHELFDLAMEGVSCTLCHQISDNGKLGTIEGDSGQFEIVAHDTAADRPAYGPFNDASGSYMQSNAMFTPVYGAHLSTSEVCASCHDLRTPSVDGEGNVITHSAESFFPEQMVFSEWRNSIYNTGQEKEGTCQSCHMPEVEGEVMLAITGGGVPRKNVSRHDFLGANTVVQSMLRDYRVELGISASEEDFNISIQQNRQFLKTAGTIDVVSSSLADEELTVTLEIQNHIGHKLPSSYPSRRVYIHFVVNNEKGEVVFESGKINSDGSIVGNDEDENSLTYEPHYNEINTEAQVQIYEAIMGNSDNNITHTLLRATHYLKENRILPEGFDKVGASNDIKVAGEAVADTDFDEGGDVITYKIKVPAGHSYNVLAELKYQPLAYGHLQDLFKDVELKPVDQFKTLFDKATLHSETIASVTHAVE